jgi:hypothetical protein
MTLGTISGRGADESYSQILSVFGPMLLLLLGPHGLLTIVLEAIERVVVLPTYISMRLLRWRRYSWWLRAHLLPGNYP